MHLANLEASGANNFPHLYPEWQAGWNWIEGWNWIDLDPLDWTNQAALASKTG